MNIKNICLIIMSAIGGFIVEFIGGVDAILKALVVFMAVDYITGVLVAIVFHKSNKTAGGGASSKEGFKGIVKKLCMLMLVGVAHSLDTIMGAEYLRATLIMFFLANEGLSILENIGLTGVKYPAFLVKALEALRENAEGEEILRQADEQCSPLHNDKVVGDEILRCAQNDSGEDAQNDGGGNLPCGDDILKVLSEVRESSTSSTASGPPSPTRGVPLLSENGHFPQRGNQPQGEGFAESGEDE